MQREVYNEQEHFHSYKVMRITGMINHTFIFPVNDLFHVRLCNRLFNVFGILTLYNIYHRKLGNGQH